MANRIVTSALVLLVVSRAASAQQGYEFEVYNTDIGKKGSSEFELNTNYVADGLTESDEALRSTDRAFRSSLEATYTLSSWLQGSVYLTMFDGRNTGLTYVGNRVKLTAVAPAKWKLPFDLGLSNEVIYARPTFSENRWAYELTPIIGKTFGAVSFAINPAFERGIGAASEDEIEMEPRGQVAYHFGDEAKVALEYYAGLGAIGESYSLREQRHQIFARVAGEIAPHLEAGLGLGRGLTASSDRWVIAAVFEYELRK